jgi:hypothetical protein
MFLVACTAFIFITTTMYLLVDDSLFNSQSIRCSHVAIINQVHALGEQEKMSNGCLVISNQTPGQFFYDSACLVARVSYYEDEAFDEAPNDDCKNEDNTDNDSNEDKQREEDCVDEVDSDEFNQVTTMVMIEMTTSIATAIMTLVLITTTIGKKLMLLETWKTSMLSQEAVK